MMVTFIGLEKQIFGYGKSSIQEDTVHVLQAIVEDLEDELQWPDAEKRQELGAVFPGMFNGCIGVSDVKEYQVVKYLDTVKERRSWSGKKQCQRKMWVRRNDRRKRARVCTTKMHILRTRTRGNIGP